MKRLERDAIILTLVEELSCQESWCGETHVQKAMYFLQEMVGVPTGFEFILYKHGPFSFDLRDELTAMRADRMVELKFLHPSYGPSLEPAASASKVLDLGRGAVAESRPAVEFVAERFGDRPVTELERLGTALYVVRKLPGRTAAEQAEEIVRLKPHITPAEARHALKTVADWQSEAVSLGLGTLGSAR
jgi:hypothetical protein